MRLIISFLLFLVLNTSFAQQKKELTEQEYLLLQDKIRLNTNRNVDSSFIYAYRMEKSNNNKHLAFANASLSYLFQLKDNTVKSKERYLLAFKYLDKMPESRDKTRLKSYLYNYGGLTEYRRGNYSRALENYQQGMKLSMELDDIIQIVKFKGNIAFDPSKPDGTQRKLLDVSKINNLGWKYKKDLNTGLEQTIEWYKSSIK